MKGRRRSRWLVPLIGIFLLSTGIAGGHDYWEQLQRLREFRANALVVEGEVIAYGQFASRPSFKVPVFRYVTASGRIIEKRSFTGGGDPPIGTRVTLLVSPNDAEYFALPDGVSDAHEIGNFVVSASFGLAGAWILIRYWRRTRLEGKA